jgi:hypothetical protein
VNTVLTVNFFVDSAIFLEIGHYAQICLLMNKLYLFSTLIRDVVIAALYFHYLASVLRCTYNNECGFILFTGLQSPFQTPGCSSCASFDEID